MTNVQNSKIFDLEERTLNFSKNTARFVRRIPRSIVNIEASKQLFRSAASVGANYIEANEALGHKDFLMRIRICIKEAKECRYWLELIESEDGSVKKELLQEATELMKIFGSILRKSMKKHEYRNAKSEGNSNNQ